MRILHIINPGLLPTSTPDYPEYLLALANKQECTVGILNLNEHWWAKWLSAGYLTQLVPQCSDRLKDIGPREDLIDRIHDACALLKSERFFEPDLYIEAMTQVWKAIQWINSASQDAVISNFGMRALNLNYDSTKEIDRFTAERERNPYAAFVDELIESFPFAKYDILCFSIHSQIDFLPIFTLIARLKEKGHTFRSVIVDHGWENLSMVNLLDKFLTGDVAAKYFDAILIYNEDTTATMLELVDCLSRGQDTSRIKNLAGFQSGRPFANKEIHYAPIEPFSQLAGSKPFPDGYYSHAYSPFPVSSLRTSYRKCYWNKCTFCVQNNKYVDAQNLSAKSAIERFLGKIHMLSTSGVRHFVLTDEALSPSDNRQLSMGILERGLDVRWFTRANVERAYDETLTGLMGRAGCREVLFGLETISQRLASLMSKTNGRLSEEQIRQILVNFDKAGIGSYINTISGFPGETPEEYKRTFAFVTDIRNRLRHPTFNFNQFALFQGSAILNNPEAFGIRPKPVPPGNDIQTSVEYEESGRDFHAFNNTFLRDREGFFQSYELLESVRQKNLRLYVFIRFILNSTAHGFLFKSRYPENPFLPAARIRACRA